MQEQWGRAVEGVCELVGIKALCGKDEDEDAKPDDGSDGQRVDLLMLDIFHETSPTALDGYNSKVGSKVMEGHPHPHPHSIPIPLV